MDHVHEAIENNLRWCSTVCRAHGVSGTQTRGLWSTPLRVPRFYPNVITRLGEFERDAQRAVIRGLVAESVAPSWAVKDSFACLDLEDLGFTPLLRAQWLWRPAQRASPLQADTVSWTTVETPESLQAWEAAWSETNALSEAGSRARLFVPALLGDSDVIAFAGRHLGRIVAGAIANRSGAVVGLSNVFVTPAAPQPDSSGYIAAIMRHFPSLPMVGYAAGPELSQAKALGFEETGPLIVWVR